MQWRELNARARLERTRDILIQNPKTTFFGCLAVPLVLTEASERFETAATDGHSLFFNAPFIESLSEARCLGLWIHEVWHLANLHHCRRRGRDFQLWNVSCDLAENPVILDAGFELPEGALCDPEFRGWAAESIFGELMRRRPTPPPAPQSQDEESEQQDEGDEGDEGESDAGQGDESQDEGAPSSKSQDGQGDAGAGQDAEGEDSASQDGGEANGGRPMSAAETGFGGILDAAGTEAELANVAADMEASVRQAISVATKANGGDVPDYLKPLVDTLNAPRIDWRAELAEFVDDSATRALSWNRPNKRFLDSGFVLPGTERDSVSKVVLVYDSSGSVGKATQDVFTAAGQSILDSGRVDCVAVIYCHARVHGPFREFRSGDAIEIELTESGGTLFGPAFEHIAQEHPDAAAVIYLTDLLPASWEFPEPSLPVLWAVDGNKRFAPFGRVLPIDPFA